MSGAKKQSNGCVLCWLSWKCITTVAAFTDVLASWAEALVSLSLAIEGLIVLKLLSSTCFFPMFDLHGYLFGSTIVGTKPTFLMGYFLVFFLHKDHYSCLSQQPLKK